MPYEIKFESLCLCFLKLTYLHGRCFCFIFLMQLSNILYFKFGLFSFVGQIVIELFSAIKSLRMFSTALPVYLLIVKNFGIFVEVCLMFRQIKLGK